VRPAGTALRLFDLQRGGHRTLYRFGVPDAGALPSAVHVVDILR
jgi:hypothetical protein